MIATSTKPKTKPKTLPPEEKERLFKKYRGLICRLAYRFSVIYGRPYDELVDQAEFDLISYICEHWANKFNPKISTEGTWAYQMIYYGLMNQCTRKQKVDVPFSVYDEDRSIDIVDTEGWAKKLMAELGEEARFLVKTILHAPAEILDDMSPTTRYRARKAVKKHLRTTERWSQAKLNRIWAEVEACL